MIQIESHRNLDVRKKAVSFVTKVYVETKPFPKSEQYGLVKELRRTAISIPSNIAEGAARNTSKEFVKYLLISRGSVAEIEAQLIIANNLGYLLKKEILFEAIQIGKMLSSLVKVIRKKI